MDYESAPVTGQDQLGLFVRDLALCLSVHRDRSPALVWPDGVDAVLAGVCGVPRQRTDPGPDKARPDAAATGLGELTAALGSQLGCEVGGSFVVLPTGGQSTGTTSGTDLVLLPVRGSCGGRVERSPSGEGTAVLDRALELRLRVGEALYVPRGFHYTLNEARSPCTLLVLALHPLAW